LLIVSCYAWTPASGGSTSTRSALAILTLELQKGKKKHGCRC
jgi:hypothetical protein